MLTGRISPCGKLPDTIAYSVEDYPSHKYFGDRERNCYAEDIYVGYRYFDTFAPKKVRYPFGFGLSYTTFDVSVQTCDVSGLTASIYVKVRNTGKYNGKEVVMMYLSRPQGELGQPVKTLCAFEKTRDLAPNEEQTLILTADLSDNASYDDSGATGNKSCFVLEKGRYSFFIGGCDSEASANIELHETAVVRRCEQALAPVEAFERFRPSPTATASRSASRQYRSARSTRTRADLQDSPQSSDLRAIGAFVSPTSTAADTQWTKSSRSSPTTSSRASYAARGWEVRELPRERRPHSAASRTGSMSSVYLRLAARTDPRECASTAEQRRSACRTAR